MPADQKLHLTTTHAWWKSLSHYNLNWQFVYFFKKLYSKLNLKQCEKGKVNVSVHTSPILIEKAVKESEKTRLWNTSVRLRNVLTHLQRHLRILLVPYENSWHSKIKNFTPTTEKKIGRYPGGEGTPLYKPYRYVPPQQVGSWAFLV